MGENNALLKHRLLLPRDTLKEADALYKVVVRRGDES